MNTLGIYVAVGIGQYLWQPFLEDEESWSKARPSKETLPRPQWWRMLRSSCVKFCPRVRRGQRRGVWVSRASAGELIVAVCGSDFC